MTPGELFEGTGKRRRVKASDPAPDNAVHAMIRLYLQLFGAKYGEPPVITPADGKALKSLIRQFGRDTVEQRLPLYFRITDAYLEGHGYPLRLLPQAWNRLTVRLEQSARADAAVDRTREYLRQLRGASDG